MTDAADAFCFWCQGHCWGHHDPSGRRTLCRRVGDPSALADRRWCGLCWAATLVRRGPNWWRLLAPACRLRDAMWSIWALRQRPPSASLSGDSEAAGGLMVTASHNPIEWNGIKCLDHRGSAPYPPAVAEQVMPVPAQRCRNRDRGQSIH